jgi:AAA+ ATPase superfamily predicted ATPase
MFQSTLPAVDAGFHDRQREIERLTALVDSLVDHSAPRWLAILGQRKVGKTSLVRELERRSRRAGLVFVVMDLFERLPITTEVFRTCALRTLDALFGSEIGLSVERLAGRPEYASRLLAHPRLASLPSSLLDLLARLPSMEMNASGVAWCADLPEQLAQALGCHVVVAWDEFQELASLAGSRSGGDVLATLRSVWQKHRRVAYLVSGSAPSILRDMVSSSHSPFFMHFEVMELGPLPEREALQLLGSASEGLLGESAAHALYRAVGGHPFYLQVCGEEILRAGPPFDEAALKETIQRLVFSTSGRLALYFSRQHAAVVGRSAHAAAALAAVAAAPPEGLRLVDVAGAMGVPAGDASRYLERLGDAVQKDEQKRYRMADPTFALWVRWREPDGRTIPMSVLGDEAEKQAAEALSRMGFDLVYQSRASRGAFDLLATRGAALLGVQVKQARLPLGFSMDEWGRMEAEAARFGWRWILAAVDPEAGVAFLDPGAARRRKTVRLHLEAAIPNLLRWLDQGA